MTTTDPKYLRGLAPEDEPDTYESEGTGSRHVENILTRPDDSSVHLIEIDFDSAYNLFREKSHLGFFDKSTNLISSEEYSSVDPQVLLERYKASMKECKQIESILFSLNNENSKENIFDALLDIQRTNLVPIPISREYKENKTSGDSDMTLVHKFKLLEERITLLEKVIGLQDSMMAQMTSGIDDKTILGALHNFQNKLNSLNPTIVNDADLLLSRLIERMSEASTDKIKEAFEDSKLLKLSEQIETNQLALDLIPHLLRRLESLSYIHKKARNFDDTLNTIESGQSQLKQIVQANKELLDRLQGNLQENMKQLQNLVDSKVKEQKTE